MTEEQECFICLENNILINSIWECNHSFCISCTNSLKETNNNCPLCRSNITNNNNTNNSNLKTNTLNLDVIRNIKPIINKNFYISKWKRKQCLDENHNFIVVRPYGVLVICETCNLIDNFNLSVV